MRSGSFFLVLLLFCAKASCQQIENASSAADRSVSVLGSQARAGDLHFDVVVVSGSSGGFGAALAAGRMGAKVALIEDTPVLGGMLSNGISNIDSFSAESLGGVFEEFRLNVKKYYAATDPNDPVFAKSKGQPMQIDGMSRQSNSPRDGGRWEPHVADHIFKEMMSAVPNVEVFYNETATGVIMAGNRIEGVSAVNKAGVSQRFFGRVIIDATHEGDIAAWAGVPYSLGMEPRSELEPHAGTIFYFDHTGEILPGSTGQQSEGIPSSGFRLTIKVYGPADGPAPLLPSPPPGYNPKEYSASAFGATPSMPHGKTEMNVNPIGSELPGANWDWPELTPAQRVQLNELYKNHALGYLYYLQHELGKTSIGLPKDEFIDNGNVPYRMFLREGRRIHGEAVMTEADINPFLVGRGLINPFHADSIVVGHYAIDAKPVLAKKDLSTPDKGEGDFFLSNAAQPFQVPYGAIVPQKVEDLLVPVALSATHVAFSAIRMDPTWTELGQAAGVAAVLSIRAHAPVRSLPVAELQKELLRQHCRLVFFWDLPFDSPYFKAIQWASLHTAFQGGDKHQFLADAPLTRSDLAVWIYNMEHLTPSVSNIHFSDVPWNHPAFREIETLYDRQLLLPLGVEPQWKKFGPYNQEKFGGFEQSSGFTEFHPEQPVTMAELVRTLRATDASPSESALDDASWLKQRLADSEYASALSPNDLQLDARVNRGRACAVIAAFLESRTGQKETP